MAEHKKAVLSKFEGLQVTASGVEMPGAAGGLREAMKVDPAELHHGQEGFIVLHFQVSKVRHEPIVKGETEPLRRVHVLQVDEAAFIDAELVEEHMATQRAKIKAAKDAAAGQDPLDGGAYTNFLLMPRKKLAVTCGILGYNKGGSKEDLAQRLADGHAADPETVEDALAQVEKDEKKSE